MSIPSALVLTTLSYIDINEARINTNGIDLQCITIEWKTLVASCNAGSPKQIQTIQNWWITSTILHPDLSRSGGAIWVRPWY